MEYGDPIGSLIGGPLPFVDDHGKAAFDRLPDVSRTDGMEKYLTARGERYQALDYAIRKCMPYMLLDFERAHGVWLDLIGVHLDVPRDARSDEYYRRVLAAYALIVYPARRTLQGLVKALIALMGDAGAVSYEPAYPKGFVVELDGLFGDDQLLWDAIKILDLSTPATYNRQVVVNPANALLGDDASGSVVIASPFVLDDASGDVDIVDPGVLAWVI